MKNKVTVGKNKKWEPGVRVGVATVRKVKDTSLMIGKDSTLRSGTVIYGGSSIGDALQTGHNAVIREENVIGDHFSLWTNSIVDYGCKIGNNVKVHCNCYVAQFTTLEDDVFLAPGVIIANDPHPGAPNPFACMKGPTIKKGAQIGCNVTILPHVTIGERALIGAGSVVTKDIPAYAVVYGNPAKVVKKISDVICPINNHKPYSTFE